MDNKRRVRDIIMWLMVIGFVCALGVYGYHNSAAGGSFTSKTLVQKSTNKTELRPGQMIEENVEIEKPTDALVFYFDSENSDVAMEKIVTLALLKNGELVKAADVSVINTGELTKSLNCSELPIGEYELQITSKQENEVSLYLYTDEAGNISITAKEQNDTMDYYCVMSIVVIIGTAFLTLLVFWLLHNHQYSIEKIYVLAALILGILMRLLIPAYFAPDEGVHINSAYELSNKIMQVEDTNPAALEMRASDANQNAMDGDLSRDDYEDYYSWETQSVDTTIVEVPVTGTGANTGYLFSALGISLGRLLHLNAFSILFLGSMCNLIICIGMIYFAMKRLPFGKTTLFMIALFPMMIQQGMSFSYDAVVIPSAIVIIAVTLYKKYTSERTRWIDIAMCIIAAVFLLTIKGGIYVLILLLPLVMLVPWKKLMEHKKIFLAGIGTIVLFGIVYICILGGKETIDITLMAQRAYQGTTCISIYEFITNPALAFTIIRDTLITNFKDYCFSTVGTNLAWLTLPTSEKGFYVIVILVILSVGSAIGDHNIVIRKRDRTTMVVTGLIPMICAVAAMLFVWTPRGLTVVQGVQGRYFLPTILVLLLAFSSGQFMKWKKEINQYLIMGMVMCDMIMFIKAIGNVNFF